MSATETTPAGTGNAGGSAEPTTPPAAPPVETQWTDERVNALAGKKHREGAERKLRELLTKFEVTSEDELAELITRGRTTEPPTKTPQERAAEKARIADERETLRKENETLKAERDGERIARMILPALSDTHDPEEAMRVVQSKTQHAFAMRDGKPVVVDGDGDKVSEDPVKWVKEQLGREEFRWLIKATTTTNVDGNPASKRRPAPKPNGEPEVDISRRGWLGKSIRESAE